MKTLSVREFLRGEYKNANETVIVMNYSKPIGLWRPINPETGAFYSEESPKEPSWTLTMEEKS